jgi:hypothetical protein
MLLFDLGLMREMYVSELPENIEGSDFESLDYNPAFCLGKPKTKTPNTPNAKYWNDFCSQCLGSVPGVSGLVKSFITKAAHGGRLLEKPGTCDFPVSLLDFNSLYPFALSKLEIPTSAPTVWKDSMNLHSYRYYILDIEILSCRSCWMYPFIKTGRRVCDKIELEDITRYCGVKYKIIRGYVFGGPVITCNTFIEELAERKQKASGAERQQLKMALNSICGKLLRKGYKTRKHKHITDKSHFRKFIAKHWARLDRFDEEKREVFLNECLDSTFNFATVGVMVLSMSKRIMNELFTECQAKNIDVLLSNTDSILIPTDKLELLRHRIGPRLGQLHVETSSCEAVIVKANKYYLSPEHYRAAGTPHATIEAGDNVRQWFIDRL